jgi:hypothetical protein
MVNTDPHSSDPRVSPSNEAAMEFATVLYVEQTAALLHLTIPPLLKAGVVANFEHICQLAQPALDFPLPDTLESAATFEP